MPAAEKLPKLESRVDRLTEFYVDWYIERLAAEEYERSGKKSLSPETPFNPYRFIEWSVWVSDYVAPFHQVPLSSTRGKEIFEQLETTFHEKK